MIKKNLINLFGLNKPRKPLDLLNSYISINREQCEQFDLERQKQLEILQNEIVVNFQNYYQSRLSALDSKQRWKFGFFLLSKANEFLPFSLLEDTIPEIPLIFSGNLEQDYINLLVEEFQTAKYEHGFTINEMGAFAELLALNHELTLLQSLEVIKYVIKIGFYNYSKTLEDFLKWENYIEISFDEVLKG